MIVRSATAKERLIDTLSSTNERRASFELARQQYVNAAVSDAVKNVNTVERIVEYDNQLVQKIYPIYMDEHRPGSYFDFSANLYQPTKYFAGVNFDTYFFNICVIWSMTVFLFITLYFDVLKRMIKILEGNRKYKRRDRQ